MIDQHAADALPIAADGTSPPHGLADTTPTIANLDGDMIVLTTAGTVRLDQGTQAIVTDPDADPRYLTVYLWDPAASDSLGIDTNGTGITLSNEQNGVSEVRIDGDLIATFSGGDDTYIYITLTPAATMDDVQRLVRAITYTSTVTNPTQVVRNSIEIELTDRSGDTAYASVDVVVAPAGTLVLSGEADDLAGTGADDLFIARGADLDDGDQLTGGGGSDTLR
ncbi:hypothetical protein AB0L20_31810, partial [Streptomyces albidoflavus]|uniref:hypothetical protein n=1 Tax=Streptomyces albidoflavus TaxID=1886 RepID=UPI00341FFF27